MAHEEHLQVALLGGDAVTRWRREQPRTDFDLEGADLRGADLRGADFDGVNLRRADLRGADLRRAHLRRADLREAVADHADFTASNLTFAMMDAVQLCGVGLSGSMLVLSSLRGANLRGANLRSADLRGASLQDTDLRRADLRGTALQGAVLLGARLLGAKLARARLAGTVLGGLDLRDVTGVKSITHEGPSVLGVDTLARSEGRIASEFLRGCGLADWEIVAARLWNPCLPSAERARAFREIDRSRGPAQVSPLFISYAHADADFVLALTSRLRRAGIRFWYDEHDATAGRVERVLEYAMKMNPTVIVVLSEASVKSDWVRYEVESARELERKLGRDVLCPISLDDTWKGCRWPRRLLQRLEDYFVVDFSRWRDSKELDSKFHKLVDGLALFYQQPEHPDG